jgi:hypothetical protein
MSAPGDTGRWWENYLVRYFMPSIAGIGIVSWILNIQPSLKPVLFFGSQTTSLDAPALTLLILYGNLFCYIASFPILCFHATRVLDFAGPKWVPNRHDGYIISFALALLMILTTLCAPRCMILCFVFILTIIYDLIQIRRFILAFVPDNPSIKILGLESTAVSRVYAYAYQLANKRNIHVKQRSPSNGSSSTDAHDKPLSETTNIGTSKGTTDDRWWRKEFTDSYRHMREHGNSAFIFVLELTLATACYGVIETSHLHEKTTISILGALLACWAAPAVCVHLLGQSLERQFSRYDEQRGETKDS